MCVACKPQKCTCTHACKRMNGERERTYSEWHRVRMQARDAWGIRLRALDSLATLSRESSRGHAACVQPRLGTHTSIFIFYAEDKIPGSSPRVLRDENTHAPCAHVCLLCLSPRFSFCCAFGGREVILHHSTHTMPLFCSRAARVQI